MPSGLMWPRWIRRSQIALAKRQPRCAQDKKGSDDETSHECDQRGKIHENLSSGAPAQNCLRRSRALARSG